MSNITYYRRFYLAFSLLALLSLLSFTNISIAADKEYFKQVSYKNYNELKRDKIKDKSWLSFQIFSTHLGFDADPVTGFTKKFSYKYTIGDDGVIKSGSINFAVDSIDTDSDGRNEKMLNYCLDHKNFKTISVKLNSNILKKNGEQKINADVTIRGIKKSVSFVIKTLEKGQKIYLTGRANISFKMFKIPNPSILIASVKDKINLNFQLILSK